MKVLILGSGGREHALAWKAAQSPRVDQVYVAPGNAGTALEPRVANVAIAADDIAALVDFARRERIGLTIVGPETPLVIGVTDAFEAAGLRCFGPRRLAARLAARAAQRFADLGRGMGSSPRPADLSGYRPASDRDAAADVARTRNRRG